MNKKIASLLTISLLSLSATSAFAVSHPGQFGFSLGGGYLKFADKRHLDNTGIATVGGYYDITDEWGMEGLIGLFDSRVNHGDSDKKSVHGALYAVNAVYHFPAYGKFQPYVLAGPGVISVTPNETDAHNEGDLNMAIGAKYDLAPYLAVKAEARDFYTWIHQRNDVMLTGAISFNFDAC